MPVALDLHQLGRGRLWRLVEFAEITEEGLIDLWDVFPGGKCRRPLARTSVSAYDVDILDISDKLW